MILLVWFWFGVLCGIAIGVPIGVRYRRPIADAVVAFVAANPVHRLCAVCGQKANPAKFHDGRYLCAEHKG